MNEPRTWRDAFVAASLDDPHRGGACLEVDELLAALDGRLDGQARDRAIAALAECPRCAALAQVAADLRGSTEVAPRHARPAVARRRARWPLALAAAFVAAIGVAVLLPALKAPTTTTLRAPPGAADARPVSGSRLASAPRELAWSAVASARTYRVEIYDAAAEPLWTSEAVGATRLDLPDSVRTRLQRGTFLWRVRAEGSDIEIGPFHFTVDP